MRKRTLNKLIRGEKGQALILVLILMLLGGLIIAPMLSYMSTGLWTGKEVYEYRMAEFYAADSGVENAIYFAKNNRNLLPTDPDTPVTVPTADVNGKTLAVQIEMTDQTDTYKVTSTATSASDKSTTIVAYVQFPPGLFDNALTAMGDENQENGTITKAGEGGSGVIDAIPSDPDRVVIFANGSIFLPQSNVIGHITYTSGTVTVQSATAITLGAPFNFGPLIQTMRSLYIDPRKAVAQNVTPPPDFPINPDPGYWTIVGGVWKISASGTYTGNNHVGPGDCVISAPTGGIITMDGTLIVDGKLTAGGFYDQIFKGPVWVKGGPSHDKTSIIKALNFNGTPHVTTFEGPVYIDGNLQIDSNSNPSTINFKSDVYVSGFLYGAPGKGNIIFKKNVYVGGARGSGSEYRLRLENGNVTFSGIVWVKDEGAGRDPTDTTFKCSAQTQMNITGGGPIIITNGVNIEGGDAKLDDMPLIMSERGNIWNSGSGDITSYLYAPNGLVHWGGGIVTGGITAKTIQISSGMNVVHADLPVPSVGSGIPIILSWETNVAVAEE